jgi:hypothetical protein
VRFLVHAAVLDLQGGHFAEIADVQVRGQRADERRPFVGVRVGKVCGAPTGAVTSPPAATSTDWSADVKRIVPDTT